MRYALAAALIATSTVALGQTLPPIVAKAYSDAKSACEPDRAKIDRGLLQQRDINGDGQPDFILSYEFVACPQGGRINCGSAGCLTQVFASTPNEYVKVLDENVQSLSFKTQRGRSVMLLGLHGGSCGKSGAEACGATLYWNGSRFSPAH